MGAPREDLIERTQAKLWRRAAYWMFLRWQVEQERADWPAVTEMPLEKADKLN